VLGVRLLGIAYQHPAQVVLTAVVTSLTFLILVLSLVFLFGPSRAPARTCDASHSTRCLGRELPR
jgi:uncharacterized phage infection (PIP) family protein YhgE